MPNPVVSALILLLLTAVFGAFGETEFATSEQYQQKSDRLAIALESFSDGVHLAYQRQGRIKEPVPVAVLGAMDQVRALFPDTPLRFSMLTDPSPNASSLATGQIYLNHGFLVEFRSVEEIIFVLAHEAAHVEAGHVAQKLMVDPIDKATQDDPAPDLAVELEIAADKEALRRMGDAGMDVSGIGALLSRLDKGDDGGVGKQRRERVGESGSSSYQAVLGPAQVSAAQFLLQVGRTDPVMRFVNETDPGPFHRAAWLAEIHRLDGRNEESLVLGREALDLKPNDLNVLRTLALAHQASGDLNMATNRWRQILNAAPGRPDAPLISAFVEQGCGADQEAKETEGRGLRFGSTRLDLPAGWRVALQTGRKLILTADTTELTRIDLWRPVPGFDCFLDLSGFDRSLRQVRSEYSPERLVLDKAQSFAGRGISADLHYFDRNGLHWRLRIYRVGLTSQAVLVVFKAPLLHYFEAHEAAADALAASLRAD